MWIVLAALRRPITVLVLAIALALGAALAIARTPRDVLPDLGVPIIYVAQTWPGMTPAQMEGLLVSKYEYHFLYIAGIEHIESQSVQGVSIMKLFFHPGTDTSFAMAQVTAMAYRASAFMPAGTAPPFIMRLDAGSFPVAQLVFESETRSDVEIQDLALYRVRPILATLPGASAPPPSGGKVRMLVVTVDPERLRALSLTPEEVVQAVARANVTMAEGVVRIGDEQLITKTNAVVPRASDLDDVPVRTGPGPLVRIRDVGRAEDGGDVVTNIVLVNGRRAVYMPITKRAGASTLDVVEQVRAKLPDMRAAIPGDIGVRLEFDQSESVRASIQGLFVESLLGALLTGLTVLVVLRDPRSAAIVVASIPTSLLFAVIGLALLGRTINLMTLGGLALAVGILVDEATVAIESIHVHLSRGKPVARAVADGMREVRGPQLTAALCICASLIPAFVMTGTAKALFGSLALAVALAMLGSYLITSTLVPVLAILWLPSSHGAPEGEPRSRFTPVAARLVSLRFLVIPVFAALSALAIWIGGSLPRDLFPPSSADRLQLRVRAPVGTRLERTEEIARDVLGEIAAEVGKDGVETTIANIGVAQPSYPVSAIFVWNGGSHEALLMVALAKGRAAMIAGGIPALEESLRARLARRFPEVGIAFEPGDPISQVLGTGVPYPVQVVVSGNDLAALRTHAERIRAELARIPTIRDLSISTPFDAPTVKIDIDRTRAGRLGTTTNRVSRSLIEATWSSQLTQPNLWVDAGGLGYFVAVRVPEGSLGSLEALRSLPVGESGESRPLLREVADVSLDASPAGFDHWNSARTVQIVANAATRDMAALGAAVERAIQAAGPAPAKDVKVAVRGRIRQMGEAADGLLAGLGLAVVVVTLLLAATFQSVRAALAALLVLPAVPAGAAVALAATGTALDIQSYTGMIMAVGVSVANAVLLIAAFVERRARGLGAAEAAAEAASARLRPILMTSVAMIAGMIPMALGLGEAGAQSAPLGRAVIGGLAASTIATLAALPSLLALVHGRGVHRSASLDPGDPESAHFQADSEAGGP